MDSLIIEDDPTTVTILEKWLSEFGETSSAPNGEEGVDMFTAALKSGFPYDLVCLDINMPGINGHETLKRIREAEDLAGNRSGVKVIMVTANSDSRNVMAAFKQKCDGSFQTEM